MPFAKVNGLIIMLVFETCADNKPGNPSPLYPKENSIHDFSYVSYVDGRCYSAVRALGKYHRDAREVFSPNLHQNMVTMVIIKNSDINDNHLCGCKGA